MATAMILAAGRGERMRPLSDAVPKPLLPLAGKPLIVWQIEALARAGFTDVVINVAWLGERIRDALGDGAAFGVRIAWSVEAEALEAAGGIATALPLLPQGPVAVVSGDVWTRYDYANLRASMAGMAAGGIDRAHLVMVPNPPYHPKGDFALAGDRILGEAEPRLTFGNIAIYNTALFGELPRGVKLKLLPLFRKWIGEGIVSGERYDGPWANVGTPQELTDLDRRLREGRAGDGASGG